MIEQKQATDLHEGKHEVFDFNEPVTEAEWWARGRIAQLEAKLDQEQRKSGQEMIERLALIEKVQQLESDLATLRELRTYEAEMKLKDDEGSTEYWRDIKRARQEQRADNRTSFADYLREHKIPFVEKNFGAHLIVEGQNCFIDFWPGTGRWNCRSGKKGFGVRNLVEYVLENYTEPRK